MKNNTQFSIRLANGKEQDFETAAAMAAWVALQQKYEAPRTRSRFKWHSGQKRTAQRLDRALDDQPPLARYANRNSGKA